MNATTMEYGAEPGLTRLIRGHIGAKRKALVGLGVGMLVLGGAGPVVADMVGTSPAGLAVATVIGATFGLLGLVTTGLGLLIAAIDPVARAVLRGDVRSFSPTRVQVRIQGIHAQTSDGIVLRRHDGREVTMWVRGMSLGEATAILRDALPNARIV